MKLRKCLYMVGYGIAVDHYSDRCANKQSVLLRFVNAIVHLPQPPFDDVTKSRVLFYAVYLFRDLIRDRV